jgi:hypothetical protein
MLDMGKAVLRGDFGHAYKSLTIPGDEYMDGMQPGIYYGNTFDSLQYRNPSNLGIQGGSGGSWVASIDGNGFNYFKYTGMDSATKAYTTCPPLTSIINRKASCYINGKTLIVDKDGKEATTAEAAAMRMLLDRPNVLQSWEEFEAQNYIYTQLYGWCLTLCIKPFGWNKMLNTKSMWNIPPGILEVKETGKFLNQNDLTGIFESIEMVYGSERTMLDLSSCIITKDFTPSFRTMVLPESRICSLAMPVNNIIGAFESRNVLINYRGALGVISHDPGSGGAGGLGGSMPMTKEQKDELQADFRRYGLRNRQIQFIITKAAIKWQQMGYPTKELMLFEEVEADTQAICDAYGHPFRLLSVNTTNSLGGTDADIFGRNLYQDTIIPEANRIYSQWTRAFDLQAKGLRIIKDFSHIPVLQENKEEAGRSRYALNQALELEWKNNIITRNRWRELNNEDTVPGDDLLLSQLPTDSTEPLVVKLGVGGVEALVSLLSAALSPEAKQATLEVVFGLTPEQAARMSAEPEPAEVEPPAPGAPTNEPPAPAA